MVEHLNVVNFLESMSKKPGIQEQDTLLAVTTLAFDIAVLELFLPIISGAKTIIATEQQAQNALLLMDYIKERGITMMQATPATWQMLMSVSWDLPQNLKILCGGESLQASLVEQLLAKNIELWNMYGPTETTIWSAIFPIVDSEISIGKPINNTQMYILDQNNKLSPIGVPGELCIAGEGVARGYWNRPELTAEKFVENPFCPGAKMYKTGDLARWRPDGNIEFLGRIDHQVKIRGFRIELGEIETALAQHESIRDVVVITRKDTSDQQQLIAYIVVKEGQKIDVSQLRSWLKQQLPEYMIPAYFISLDKLPLTPNGKIDRNALPAPDTLSILQGEYMAPRNETEEKLANIWQEVLGINQVGIYDNFFEVGGHSLLLIQLLDKIESQFQRGRISLNRLLQYPTIVDIAQWITSENKADIAYIHAIKSTGTKRPLFLAPGIEGHSLVFQDMAKLIDTEQPLYSFQAPGLHNECDPLENIPEIAALYNQLLRKIQPDSRYVLGGYSFGCAVSFEMALQLIQNGFPVPGLILIDGALKMQEQHAEESLIEVIEGWILQKKIPTQMPQYVDRFMQANQSILQSIFRGESGMAKGFLQVLKANYRALGNYIPKQSLDIPVFYLRTQETTQNHDFVAQFQEYCVQKIQVVDIEGDHFSIFQSPHVQTLVAQLAQCLQKIRMRHAVIPGGESRGIQYNITPNGVKLKACSCFTPFGVYYLVVRLTVD